MPEVQSEPKHEYRNKEKRWDEQGLKYQREYEGESHCDARNVKNGQPESFRQAIRVTLRGANTFQ